MVKITKNPKKKSSKRVFEYPASCGEYVMINKQIKKDFSKLCKERKISKSGLIESFYRSILLRFKDGSLNKTYGYITIKVE